MLSRLPTSDICSVQQQTHCAKDNFAHRWEKFTAGEKKRTLKANRRGLDHSEALRGACIQQEILQLGTKRIRSEQGEE